MAAAVSVLSPVAPAAEAVVPVAKAAVPVAEAVVPAAEAAKKRFLVVYVKQTKEGIRTRLGGYLFTNKENMYSVARQDHGEYVLLVSPNKFTHLTQSDQKFLGLSYEQMGIELKNEEGAWDFLPMQSLESGAIQTVFRLLYQNRTEGSLQTRVRGVVDPDTIGMPYQVGGADSAGELPTAGLSFAQSNGTTKVFATGMISDQNKEQAAIFWGDGERAKQYLHSFKLHPLIHSLKIEDSADAFLTLLASKKANYLRREIKELKNKIAKPNLEDTKKKELQEQLKEAEANLSEEAKPETIEKTKKEYAEFWQTRQGARKLIKIALAGNDNLSMEEGAINELSFSPTLTPEEKIKRFGQVMGAVGELSNIYNDVDRQAPGEASPLALTVRYNSETKGLEIIVKGKGGLWKEGALLAVEQGEGDGKVWVAKDSRITESVFSEFYVEDGVLKGRLKDSFMTRFVPVVDKLGGKKYFLTHVFHRPLAEGALAQPTAIQKKVLQQYGSGAGVLSDSGERGRLALKLGYASPKIPISVDVGKDPDAATNTVNWLLQAIYNEEGLPTREETDDEGRTNIVAAASGRWGKEGDVLATIDKEGQARFDPNIQLSVSFLKELAGMQRVPGAQKNAVFLDAKGAVAARIVDQEGQLGVLVVSPEKVVSALEKVAFDEAEAMAARRIIEDVLSTPTGEPLQEIFGESLERLLPSYDVRMFSGKYGETPVISQVSQLVLYQDEKGKSLNDLRKYSDESLVIRPGLRYGGAGDAEHQGKVLLVYNSHLDIDPYIEAAALSHEKVNIWTDFAFDLGVGGRPIVMFPNNTIISAGSGLRIIGSTKGDKYTSPLDFYLGNYRLTKEDKEAGRKIRVAKVAYMTGEEMTDEDGIAYRDVLPTGTVFSMFENAREYGSWSGRIASGRATIRSGDGREHISHLVNGLVADMRAKGVERTPDEDLPAERQDNKPAGEGTVALNRALGGGDAYLWNAPERVTEEGLDDSLHDGLEDGLEYGIRMNDLDVDLSHGIFISGVEPGYAIEGELSYARNRKDELSVVDGESRVKISQRGNGHAAKAGRFPGSPFENAFDFTFPDGRVLSLESIAGIDNKNEIAYLPRDGNFSVPQEIIVGKTFTTALTAGEAFATSVSDLILSYPGGAAAEIAGVDPISGEPVSERIVLKDFKEGFSIRDVKVKFKADGTRVFELIDGTKVSGKEAVKAFSYLPFSEDGIDSVAFSSSPAVIPWPVQTEFSPGEGAGEGKPEFGAGNRVEIMGPPEGQVKIGERTAEIFPVLWSGEHAGPAGEKRRIALEVHPFLAPKGFEGAQASPSLDGEYTVSPEVLEGVTLTTKKNMPFFPLARLETLGLLTTEESEQVTFRSQVEGSNNILGGFTIVGGVVTYLKGSPIDRLKYSITKGFHKVLGETPNDLLGGAVPGDTIEDYFNEFNGHAQEGSREINPTKIAWGATGLLGLISYDRDVSTIDGQPMTVYRKGKGKGEEATLIIDPNVNGASGLLVNAKYTNKKTGEYFSAENYFLEKEKEETGYAPSGRLADMSFKAQGRMWGPSLLAMQGAPEIEVETDGTITVERKKVGDSTAKIKGRADVSAHPADPMSFLYSSSLAPGADLGDPAEEVSGLPIYFGRRDANGERVFDQGLLPVFEPMSVDGYRYFLPKDEESGIPQFNIEEDQPSQLTLAVMGQEGSVEQMTDGVFLGKEKTAHSRILWDGYFSPQDGKILIGKLTQFQENLEVAGPDKILRARGRGRFGDNNSIRLSEVDKKEIMIISGAEALVSVVPLFSSAADGNKSLDLNDYMEAADGNFLNLINLKSLYDRGAIRVKEGAAHYRLRGDFSGVDLRAAQEKTGDDIFQSEGGMRSAANDFLAATKAYMSENNKWYRKWFGGMWFQEQVIAPSLPSIDLSSYGLPEKVEIQGMVIPFSGNSGFVLSEEGTSAGSSLLGDGYWGVNKEESFLYKRIGDPSPAAKDAPKEGFFRRLVRLVTSSSDEKEAPKEGLIKKTQILSGPETGPMRMTPAPGPAGDGEVVLTTGSQWDFGMEDPEGPEPPVEARIREILEATPEGRHVLKIGSGLSLSYDLNAVNLVAYDPTISTDNPLIQITAYDDGVAAPGEFRTEITRKTRFGTKASGLVRMPDGEWETFGAENLQEKEGPQRQAYLDARMKNPAYSFEAQYSAGLQLMAIQGQALYEKQELLNKLRAESYTPDINGGGVGDYYGSFPELEKEIKELTTEMGILQKRLSETKLALIRERRDSPKGRASDPLARIIKDYLRELWEPVKKAESELRDAARGAYIIYIKTEEGWKKISEEGITSSRIGDEFFSRQGDSTAWAVNLSSLEWKPIEKEYEAMVKARASLKEALRKELPKLTYEQREEIKILTQRGAEWVESINPAIEAMITINREDIQSVGEQVLSNELGRIDYQLLKAAELSQELHSSYQAVQKGVGLDEGVLTRQYTDDRRVYIYEKERYKNIREQLSAAIASIETEIQGEKDKSSPEKLIVLNQLRLSLAEHPEMTVWRDRVGIALGMPTRTVEGLETSAVVLGTVVGPGLVANGARLGLFGAGALARFLAHGGTQAYVYFSLGTGHAMSLANEGRLMDSGEFLVTAGSAYAAAGIFAGAGMGLGWLGRAVPWVSKPVSYAGRIIPGASKWSPATQSLVGGLVIGVPAGAGTGLIYNRAVSGEWFGKGWAEHMGIGAGIGAALPLTVYGGAAFMATRAGQAAATVVPPVLAKASPFKRAVSVLALSTGLATVEAATSTTSGIDRYGRPIVNSFLTDIFGHEIRGLMGMVINPGVNMLSLGNSWVRIFKGEWGLADRAESLRMRSTEALYSYLYDKGLSGLAFPVSFLDNYIQAATGSIALRGMLSEPTGVLHDLLAAPGLMRDLLKKQDPNATAPSARSVEVFALAGGLLGSMAGFRQMGNSISLATKAPLRYRKGFHPKTLWQDYAVMRGGDQILASEVKSLQKLGYFFAKVHHQASNLMWISTAITVLGPGLNASEKGTALSQAVYSAVYTSDKTATGSFALAFWYSMLGAGYGKAASLANKGWNKFVPKHTQQMFRENAGWKWGAPGAGMAVGATLVGVGEFGWLGKDFQESNPGMANYMANAGYFLLGISGLRMGKNIRATALYNSKLWKHEAVKLAGGLAVGSAALGGAYAVGGVENGLDAALTFTLGSLAGRFVIGRLPSLSVGAFELASASSLAMGIMKGAIDPGLGKLEDWMGWREEKEKYSFVEASRPDLQRDLGRALFYGVMGWGIAKTSRVAVKSYRSGIPDPAKGFWKGIAEGAKKEWVRSLRGVYERGVKYPLSSSVKMAGVGGGMIAWGALDSETLGWNKEWTSSRILDAVSFKGTAFGTGLIAAGSVILLGALASRGSRIISRSVARQSAGIGMAATKALTVNIGAGSIQNLLMVIAPLHIAVEGASLLTNTFVLPSSYSIIEKALIGSTMGAFWQPTTTGPDGKVYHGNFVKYEEAWKSFKEAKSVSGKVSGAGRIFGIGYFSALFGVDEKTGKAKVGWEEIEEWGKDPQIRKVWDQLDKTNLIFSGGLAVLTPLAEPALSNIKMFNIGKKFQAAGIGIKATFGDVFGKELLAKKAANGGRLGIRDTIKLGWTRAGNMVIGGTFEENVGEQVIDTFFLSFIPLEAFGLGREFSLQAKEWAQELLSPMADVRANTHKNFWQSLGIKGKVVDVRFRGGAVTPEQEAIAQQVQGKTPEQLRKDPQLLRGLAEMLTAGNTDIVVEMEGGHQRIFEVSSSSEWKEHFLALSHQAKMQEELNVLSGPALQDELYRLAHVALGGGTVGEAHPAEEEAIRTAARLVVASYALAAQAAAPAAPAPGAGASAAPGPASPTATPTVPPGGLSLNAVNLALTHQGTISILDRLGSNPLTIDLGSLREAWAWNQLNPQISNAPRGNFVFTERHEKDWSPRALRLQKQLQEAMSEYEQASVEFTRTHDEYEQAKLGFLEDKLTRLEKQLAWEEGIRQYAPDISRAGRASVRVFSNPLARWSGLSYLVGVFGWTPTLRRIRERIKLESQLDAQLARRIKEIKEEIKNPSVSLGKVIASIMGEVSSPIAHRERRIKEIEEKIKKKLEDDLAQLLKEQRKGVAVRTAFSRAYSEHVRFELLPAGRAFRREQARRYAQENNPPPGVYEEAVKDALESLGHTREYDIAGVANSLRPVLQLTVAPTLQAAGEQYAQRDFGPGWGGQGGVSVRFVAPGALRNFAAGESTTAKAYAKSPDSEARVDLDVLENLSFEESEGRLSVRANLTGEYNVRHEFTHIGILNTVRSVRSSREELAYKLWELEGRVSGRQDRHWELAGKIIAQGKTEEVIRAVAQELWEATGQSDERENWRKAEDFVKQEFYNGRLMPLLQELAAIKGVPVDKLDLSLREGNDNEILTHYLTARALAGDLAGQMDRSRGAEAAEAGKSSAAHYFMNLFIKAGERPRGNVFDAVRRLPSDNLMRLAHHYVQGPSTGIKTEKQKEARDTAEGILDAAALEMMEFIDSAVKEKRFDDLTETSLRARLVATLERWGRDAGVSLAVIPRETFLATGKNTEVSGYQPVGDGRFLFSGDDVCFGAEIEVDGERVQMGYRYAGSQEKRQEAPAGQKFPSLLTVEKIVREPKQPHQRTPEEAEKEKILGPLPEWDLFQLSEKAPGQTRGISRTYNEFYLVRVADSVTDEDLKALGLPTARDKKGLIKVPLADYEKMRKVQGSFSDRPIISEFQKSLRGTYGQDVKIAPRKDSRSAEDRVESIASRLARRKILHVVFGEEGKRGIKGKDITRFPKLVQIALGLGRQEGDEPSRLQREDIDRAGIQAELQKFLDDQVSNNKLTRVDRIRLEHELQMAVPGAYADHDSGKVVINGVTHENSPFLKEVSTEIPQAAGKELEKALRISEAIVHEVLALAYQKMSHQQAVLAQKAWNERFAESRRRRVREASASSSNSSDSASSASSPLPASQSSMMSSPNIWGLTEEQMSLLTPSRSTKYGPELGKATKGITYRDRFAGLNKHMLRETRRPEAEAVSSRPFIHVEVGIGKSGAPTVFDLARELSNAGYKNAIIYAVDNNKNYIDQARSQLEEQGLPEGIRIEFIQEGDFDLVRHGIKEADQIRVANVLQYYSQAQQKIAVGRMLGSLNDNGRMYVVEQGVGAFGQRTGLRPGQVSPHRNEMYIDVYSNEGLLNTGRYYQDNDGVFATPPVAPPQVIPAPLAVPSQNLPLLLPSGTVPMAAGPSDVENLLASLSGAPNVPNRSVGDLASVDPTASSSSNVTEISSPIQSDGSGRDSFTAPDFLRVLDALADVRGDPRTSNDPLRILDDALYVISENNLPLNAEEAERTQEQFDAQMRDLRRRIGDNVSAPGFEKSVRELRSAVVTNDAPRIQKAQEEVVSSLVEIAGPSLKGAGVQRQDIARWAGQVFPALPIAGGVTPIQKPGLASASSPVRDGARMSQPTGDTFRGIYNLGTRSNGVLSRAKFTDDLIRVVRANKNSPSAQGIMVGYFKVQDFKRQFNTRGEEVGVAHELGDIALRVIGPEFEKSLREELAGTDIRFSVYNSGPVFQVIFSGVNEGQKSAVEQALKRIVVAERSEFKKAVIAAVKERSGVADKLQDFSSENFHIYAGLSSSYAVSEGEAVLEVVDRLDREAAQTAKYAQLMLADNLPGAQRDLYSMTLGKLAGLNVTVPDPKERREKIDRLIAPLLQKVRGVQGSNLVSYSDGLDKILALNEELGLGNEFDVHRPLSAGHQGRRTYDELQEDFQTAWGAGDPERIDSAVDELVERVVRYTSPRILPRDNIFAGNQHFKNVINRIMEIRPADSLQVVFRLGEVSDEYGAVIWDAPSQRMVIFRVDGNNVGAISNYHGRQAGDEITDGQLQVIREVLNDSALEGERTRSLGERLAYVKENLPAAIQRFFAEKDYRQTPVAYPITQPEVTIAKAAAQRMMPDGSEWVYMLDTKTHEVFSVTLGEGDRVWMRNGQGALVAVPETEEPVEVDRLNAFEVKIRSVRDNIQILKISPEQYRQLERAQKVVWDHPAGPVVPAVTEPMVSMGYVEVDARELSAGGYDFSVLQGRADSAAERLKNSSKAVQMQSGGSVLPDGVVASAPAFNPRQIGSLPRLEMSEAERFIADAVIAKAGTARQAVGQEHPAEISSPIRPSGAGVEVRAIGTASTGDLIAAAQAEAESGRPVYIYDPKSRNFSRTDKQGTRASVPAEKVETGALVFTLPGGFAASHEEVRRFVGQNSGLRIDPRATDLAGTMFETVRISGRDVRVDSRLTGHTEEFMFVTWLVDEQEIDMVVVSDRRDIPAGVVHRTTDGKKVFVISQAAREQGSDQMPQRIKELARRYGNDPLGFKQAVRESIAQGDMGQRGFWESIAVWAGLTAVSKAGELAQGLSEAERPQIPVKDYPGTSGDLLGKVYSREADGWIQTTRASQDSVAGAPSSGRSSSVVSSSSSSPLNAGENVSSRPQSPVRQQPSSASSPLPADSSIPAARAGMTPVAAKDILARGQWTPLAELTRPETKVFLVTTPQGERFVVKVLRAVERGFDSAKFARLVGLQAAVPTVIVDSYQGQVTGGEEINGPVILQEYAPALVETRVDRQTDERVSTGRGALVDALKLQKDDRAKELISQYFKVLRTAIISGIANEDLHFGNVGEHKGAVKLFDLGSFKTTGWAMSDFEMIDEKNMSLLRQSHAPKAVIEFYIQGLNNLLTRDSAVRYALGESGDFETASSPIESSGAQEREERNNIPRAVKAAEDSARLAAERSKEAMARADEILARAREAAQRPVSPARGLPSLDSNNAVGSSFLVSSSPLTAEELAKWEEEKARKTPPAPEEILRLELPPELPPAIHLIPPAPLPAVFHMVKADSPRWPGNSPRDWSAKSHPGRWSEKTPNDWPEKTPNGWPENPRDHTEKRTEVPLPASPGPVSSAPAADPEPGGSGGNGTGGSKGGGGKAFVEFVRQQNSSPVDIFVLASLSHKEKGHPVARMSDRDSLHKTRFGSSGLSPGIISAVALSAKGQTGQNLGSAEKEETVVKGLTLEGVLGSGNAIVSNLFDRSGLTKNGQNGSGAVLEGVSKRSTVGIEVVGGKVTAVAGRSLNRNSRWMNHGPYAMIQPSSIFKKAADVLAYPVIGTVLGIVRVVKVVNVVNVVNVVVNSVREYCSRGGFGPAVVVRQNGFDDNRNGARSAPSSEVPEVRLNLGNSSGNRFMFSASSPLPSANERFGRKNPYQERRNSDSSAEKPIREPLSNPNNGQSRDAGSASSSITYGFGFIPSFIPLAVFGDPSSLEISKDNLIAFGLAAILLSLLMLKNVIQSRAPTSDTKSLSSFNRNPTGSTRPTLLRAVSGRVSLFDTNLKGQIQGGIKWLTITAVNVLRSLKTSYLSTL
ncbi:MAG: DUF2934 domain-containing protein [Candidatus Omnitrophota bacterium]